MLLPPRKFAVFLKDNFSSNISPKEPNISPITKFQKLFKCLQSICVYGNALGDVAAVVSSHMSGSIPLGPVYMEVGDPR